MRRSFRFDPPRAPLEEAVRWLLARALGPPAAELAGRDEVDSDRALDLGDRLDLLPRVGARTPPEVLERELGAQAAAVVRQRFQTTAAAAVQAEGLCRQLAPIARELGAPLIFLKGMALHLQGRAAPGARPLGDVDVLTTRNAAPLLRERLLTAGYRPTGFPPEPHQLSGVVHPAGVLLEIHTSMRGVRIGGAASATAPELVQRGLTRSAPGLPEGCHVPATDVLLSHLLVHGLAQHGLAPEAYPMARLLADLEDLGLEREGWDAWLEHGFGWVARDVSRREVEVARDLVLRLAAGADPADVWEEGTQMARLLRHVVLGALEEPYRQALKLRSQLHPPPREGGRLLERLRQALRAVWLTEAQIDVIYGRPRRRLGYLGWRLWRPVDLVLRTLRYSASWLSDRRRAR